MSDIRRVDTSDPIMDNLVYYTKRLGFESIFKNEALALEAETNESIKSSDLYLASLEKTSVLTMYTMDRDILLGAGIQGPNIEYYTNNPSLIPKNLQPIILERTRQKYINNYKELNNYYRMLNGLPNIGEKGIYIEENLEYLDTTKPIHEMSYHEIVILEVNGILNEYKEKYPDAKYLNYLNDKKVSIYEARRSGAFQLLRVPEIINADDVISRFKDKYERNRVYTLKCVYSEAFKLRSDFYDNFIQVFIIVQTITNIIVELPDMLIKKEFFDLKSIKYMFESYGIDYYEEIPFKYQLLMLKNLNKLLKYKSTTKNMIDICNLFGFKNIKLFKYYLLKDRNVDQEGKYINNKLDILDDEQNVIGQEEDYLSNYNLKFIKVPIEDVVDDYIRQSTSHVDYDDLTLNDIYWDGHKEHDLVKKTILENEFNLVRTKYISIDSVYDMTKLSFELSYFFNILFESGLLNTITISIPAITTSNKLLLSDTIYYLFLLMYETMGIEDTILDTRTKVLHVKGFNFKQNLGEIATKYSNMFENPIASLGIKGFRQDKIITSFKQLFEIYTTNKNIHDHLIKQMQNANSIQEYEIFKDLYDALMITELNYDLFEIGTGDNKRIASTYTEYFQYKNSPLYIDIVNIRQLTTGEKTNMINSRITDIIFTLENSFEDDKFGYLMTNIPGLTGEIIKKYIYKVINFFKSYMVDFTNINTIYTISDTEEGKIFINDGAKYDIDLIRSSIVQATDKMRYELKYEWNSEMNIIDEYTRLIKYELKEIYRDNDDIKQLVIYDNMFVSGVNVGNIEQAMHYNDDINLKIDKTLNDSVGITDHIFISANYN